MCFHLFKKVTNISTENKTHFKLKSEEKLNGDLIQNAKSTLKKFYLPFY